MATNFCNVVLLSTVLSLLRAQQVSVANSICISFWNLNDLASVIHILYSPWTDEFCSLLVVVSVVQQSDTTYSFTAALCIIFTALEASVQTCGQASNVGRYQKLKSMMVLEKFTLIPQATLQQLRSKKKCQKTGDFSLFEEIIPISSFQKSFYTECRKNLGKSLVFSDIRVKKN